MRKILITAFILLCGIAGRSQVYFPVYPTIYGQHSLRIKVDSALLVPSKDTLSINSSDSSAQIFYNKKDKYFYGFSLDKGFFKIGSGTDSSSYHTIGQASDSSYFTISKPDGTVDTVRFVMDSTGGSSSYTLPVASGSTLGGIKVGSGLSIDGSGVLSTSLPYTSYVAALTQSGTSAPVAVVSQNNTGFTFTYTYVSVGRYLLTCSGTAFATAHSFVMTQNQAFSTPVLFESTTGGTTQLNLFTRKTDGTSVDGSLNGEIEIRIYP